MLGSDTTVPSADFRRALTSLGCNLKPYQLNQIIAFITPGDEVPMEQFLYVLRGTVPPLDGKQPENMAAYQRLLKAVEDRTSSANVDWEQHVISLVRSKDHPEVVEALRDYAAPVYVRNVYNVESRELQNLLQDMYAISPETFARSMDTIWDI